MMHKINFGFYNEYDVIDVWSGQLHNNKSIIENYIKEFLEIVCGKPEPICFPFGTKKENPAQKEFISTYSNFEFVKYNISCSNDYMVFECDDEDQILKISQYIKILLGYDYKKIQLEFQSELKKLKAKEPLVDYKISTKLLSFIKAQANPHYIAWSIRNNDDFYLNTNNIETLNCTKSNHLASFEIINIDKNTLQFIPKFENNQYTIESDLIKICEKRKEAFDNYVRQLIEEEDWERENSDYDNSETWADGSCICCEQNPCICYD